MIPAALTRSSRTAAAAAAAALVLAACGSAAQPSAGSAEPAGGPDRLTVVTTVSPITSIVANVAGGLVDIVGVVPEGTNSHTFEPPPSAAKVLSNADVVFLNGLKLEDPTAELAKTNAKKGSEVVELGTLSLPESG